MRGDDRGTAGLPQKLVHEKATLKLGQYGYCKKHDGYVSWYAVVESWMDSLEKSRRERKSSMRFPVDFLRNLARWGVVGEFQ